MAFLTDGQLAFIFGLLGNMVSFLVFLAPVPTFYKIYKKKSSQGYHSIPYVIALCSATLLLYYGFLKSDAYLIISINTIGGVIEKFTLRLILVLNIGAFGAMMLVTNFILKGRERVTAVGWICAAYNVAVFAAPLSIMKQVITTKSVEFMPFSLSFFLVISAAMWFFYGLFVKDFFIALPNVLGFLFGIAQMILYFAYKDKEKHTKAMSKQEENTDNKFTSLNIETPKDCYQEL